jgi:Casein kinase II regulatory subunit
LLPAGQDDVPRKSTVCLYCARCNDIYSPKSSRHLNIDGAYFGTTFPHLFLMTFSNIIPPPLTASYVPRVFGFRIRRETPAVSALKDAPRGEGSSSNPTGRTSEIASVLPQGEASLRRITGQDDFFDDDDLEEEEEEEQEDTAIGGNSTTPKDPASSPVSLPRGLDIDAQADQLAANLVIAN